MTVSNLSYSLGTEVLELQKTVFTSTSPFVLLHLHANENTADAAARELSKKRMIEYIRVKNNNTRLISFQNKGTIIKFDPNRIFTDAGLKASLSLNSRNDAEAFAKVSEFRSFLLRQLPAGKTIVSVHNNSNGAFSIEQYKQNKQGDVHINSSLDTDDFYITNDAALFRRLVVENKNVVLEYKDKLTDDGSLSIYCANAGISYINVEAEHGHQVQQTEMLEILYRLLK